MMINLHKIFTSCTRRGVFFMKHRIHCYSCMADQNLNVMLTVILYNFHRGSIRPP